MSYQNGSLSGFMDEMRNTPGALAYSHSPPIMIGGQAYGGGALVPQMTAPALQFMENWRLMNNPMGQAAMNESVTHRLMQTGLPGLPGAIQNQGDLVRFRMSPTHFLQQLLGSTMANQNDPDAMRRAGEAWDVYGRAGYLPPGSISGGFGPRPGPGAAPGAGATNPFQVPESFDSRMTRALRQTLTGLGQQTTDPQGRPLSQLPIPTDRGLRTRAITNLVNQVLAEGMDAGQAGSLENFLASRFTPETLRGWFESEENALRSQPTEHWRAIEGLARLLNQSRPGRISSHRGLGGFGGNRWHQYRP